MRIKRQLRYLPIIPARAGSVRLPGKNMRLLSGIPLIGHSINYAKENGFQNLVVTTNDNEVENYTLQEGINIVKRPDEIAGPHEPTITALQHVLGQLKEKYQAVILLQPTNPLRPKELLKEAIAQFEEGDYDSLMTVTRSDKKLGKIKDNTFVPYNYTMGQRSQDIEPLYYENGLLYIIKTEIIMAGKLLGDNNFPFIIDHPYAEIDIDTLADFKKAEAYLKIDF
tara:strand:+ start:3501 stop:4175 length:675 start_codon:yes stop_codon:yes gene_type:complete